MNYTQSIGNLNELKCIARFIELGYECSIPYGNGAKYDFIADIEGKLIRIQCKSSKNPRKNGVVDENAIQISTISQTTNTQKTTRHLYDSSQIDYFATYFNNKVYLIPVNECSTNKTLRFKPPLNRNENYNKAEDYEIEKIIPISTELLNSKKEFENRTFIQQQQILYCKECGKPVSNPGPSGLCLKCYSIVSRKCQRPSREELKKMIRTIPFTKIGEHFGVSDNAVRRWCDAEKLPRKVSQIKQYSQEEWEKI